MAAAGAVANNLPGVVHGRPAKLFSATKVIGMDVPNHLTATNAATPVRGGSGDPTAPWRQVLVVAALGMLAASAALFLLL